MNKQFGADLIFVDDFNWNDNGKDLTGPVLQYVKDSFVRDNYLDKDKVREAIKKAIEMDIAQGFWLSTPTTYADYDIRKKDYQLKKKQFANIIISLFPEGVEGKEEK